MNLNVEDKVFLLAGASRGLGYAIAEELAANGAKVYLGSRDTDAVSQAAQTLSEQYGVVSDGSELNAADAASISRWVAAARQRFGTIDGLLVNAGGPPPGQFNNFTDGDWQDAFELTLMSAVRMIREVLPDMQAARSGAILTLTSSSVKEPIDFLLLSNVMRAGVTSLAKSLSHQLAADGIRVNNLVPGVIYTDRIKSLDSLQAQLKEIPVEQQRADAESSIPMGRYGEPREFGKAGAFLLSDAASYITGSTLVVDGGTMKSLF
ncbi:SDR family oxidoreductase [Spongiibacter nanhainus]|uniref:SDR family oxidoreductase n=2 Tax=Spongiibacter nanhainus TaxID=2794344 RepID=A0A7T4R4H3_9GAMM|nr:SDR family oxidoreductase [Spongiibacter nanhainus]